MPERGVALKQFHRTEAFARRQANIGGGDVVLEINERLAAGQWVNQQRLAHGFRRSLRRLRRWGGVRGEARLVSRFGAGARAVGERLRQGQAVRMPRRRLACRAAVCRERTQPGRASQVGLAPRWQDRWTVGFQPPAIASRSAVTRCRCPAASAIMTRCNSGAPRQLDVPTAEHPRAGPHRQWRAGQGTGVPRGSTTAATAEPVRRQSASVRQPSSLTVSRTIRAPGRTAKRLM